MTTYPYVVKVPDVPKPKGVCWKQKLDGPRAMTRCTLPKGHDTGKRPTPHSWER